MVNLDPMKTKQEDKGIRQLTDEGVAQLFIKQPGNRKIVGTVGVLQFDVIQFRLLHEYGANCRFDSMNYYKAAWIKSDNPSKLNDFMRLKEQNIVLDKEDRPVFLSDSEWALDMAMQNNKEIEFYFTSEYKKDVVIVDY